MQYNTHLQYKFEPHDKILVVALQTKVMISQPLIQNTFILRWPRVAIFVDIIKFVTMFIKAIFKSKKKKGNYVSKCNLYLYFLIFQNLIISGEKF